MPIGRFQIVRRLTFLLPILLLFCAFSPASQPVRAQNIPTATANPAESSSKPYSLPPAKLRQAQALSTIRTTLYFGSEFWQIAVLLTLLATGSVAKFAAWSESTTKRPWLQSLLFSVLMIAILFLISEAPIAAIGHIYSLRYGISVQSWPSWLLDLVKSLGVTLAIGTPILMLASGVMRWRWSCRRYWLWFWAAMVPITVLGAFLLPQIIEPIFNTYQPLAKSHPALVTDLERVVARTGTNIPPNRMFLMKASDKSNGLNAYVTGIGSTKRIVVWDTTADRMPADEILFTFAHESGHYVLNHIPKGLAAGAIGMLVLFWATNALAQGLVRRFGIKWSTDDLASLPGLAVLLFAASLLQVFADPIENTASRYIEHQADVYGQEAIHTVVPDPQKTAVAAFNRLGAAYLDDPDPNPFLEAWTYDHPSIQSRAIFAEHYNPWAAAQVPRYFPGSHERNQRPAPSYTEPAMDCLFCKIVAGAIPAPRVFEDDQSIAFADINPQAPTHVLIVPRQHIPSLAEATAEDSALLGHLLWVTIKVAREKGLAHGYRVVLNSGPDGGQTVDHLHIHLLGGRHMNWPPG